MQGLAQKFITQEGQYGVPPGTGDQSVPFVGGTVQATVDAANVFDSNGAGNQLRAVVGADFAYAGDTAFVLTAASCILTYALGQPVRTFLFALSVSAEATTPPNAGTCGFVISHNNDLLNAALGGNAQSAAGRCSAELIATGAVSGACFRRIQLTPGDTIRPLGGQFAGTTSLNIASLSLCILKGD